jgi:hypothetical protein
MRCTKRIIYFCYDALKTLPPQGLGGKRRLFQQEHRDGGPDRDAPKGAA